MKNPFRSTSTNRGRFAIMGLPIVLMALGLAVFVALAPAPERGFNSPSAEAARPKVQVLGLMYHDFGLGSASVTLDKDPSKAHFQPGPDSNHGPVVLNDGDTIFVEVDSGDSDLGNSTRLAISGAGIIKIHTSCSKPLEVGFFYGADGDETAEDLSEFGGGGFQAGFEVIELILTSGASGGDCVQATATPTPTDTPPNTPTDTPTNTPTSTPTETITPTETPTTPPELGSITICKDTKPEDTGTIFDFDTDIPGMTNLDLADGECATQDDLDQGDYEITEDLSALPEWELYHIHCDGVSFDNIDVDLGNATVSVHLESGADVECTFFNKLNDEPEPGSITVCVVTDPAATGKSFDFDTDIPGMTDMDLEHGECDSQAGLDEGDYEITEDLFGLPSGWRLEDIDCDGTSSGNIDIDLGHATVSIFLPQGEDVECTFFNKFKEDEPTSTPVPEKTCDDFAMGDVNGPAAKPGDERKVNSIDAAIILQFNAGHINSLPCPKNADVNQDGKIDAMDALIIIQFTAKFIFHLPV